MNLPRNKFPSVQQAFSTPSSPSSPSWSSFCDVFLFLSWYLFHQLSGPLLHFPFFLLELVRVPYSNLKEVPMLGWGYQITFFCLPLHSKFLIYIKIEVARKEGWKLEGNFKQADKAGADTANKVIIFQVLLSTTNKKWWS